MVHLYKTPAGLDVFKKISQIISALLSSDRSITSSTTSDIKQGARWLLHFIEYRDLSSYQSFKGRDWILLGPMKRTPLIWGQPCGTGEENPGLIGGVEQQDNHWFPDFLTRSLNSQYTDQRYPLIEHPPSVEKREFTLETFYGILFIITPLHPNVELFHWNYFLSSLMVTLFGTGLSPDLMFSLIAQLLYQEGDIYITSYHQPVNVYKTTTDCRLKK